MKKLEIPGAIAVVIASVLAALVNYFGAGGAGFEWLYAPIALSALGVIAKFLDVQGEPEPTNQPAARGMGDAPAQPDKMQRFLLG